MPRQTVWSIARAGNGMVCQRAHGTGAGIYATSSSEERGEEPLTLEIELSGDLLASVDSEKTELTLIHQDGQVVLRYGGLTAIDDAGKPLAARMQIEEQSFFCGLMIQEQIIR